MSAYLFATIFIIPVALLHGRVAADLWQWFVLPLWPWLPVISTLQFAGLMLLKGMIFQRRPKLKGEEIALLDGLSVLLLHPIAAWGIGWLFHYWLAP